MAYRVRRDDVGTPLIEAGDETELYRGLGHVHAQDRGMQLLLMRLLGRGQASQHLDGSDELLEVDTFFRRMNWKEGVEAEVTKLPADLRRLLEAYCEGINARLLRRVPLELKLLRYRPDPWTPADCMLISRMTGYLTLAQSQGEVERLVLQMIQRGVDRARLEELFPGQLEDYDASLLQRVRFHEKLVPDSLRWEGLAPRLMASNNWVVAGRHTASGKPMLASDPHLECNRLPNVWHEVTLRSPTLKLTGATIPGLPAVIIGRNEELAWGVTYAFMDAVDSWVEDCRDGRYRSGDDWKDFRRRPERILRKGREAVDLCFYENEHGVLDGAPDEDGLYLATRASVSQAGAASLIAAARLNRASRVKEGMEAIGSLEAAFNWVLADAHGDIGYQMSGLLPVRAPGRRGLLPLLGWEPAHSWQGFVAPTELPRQFNPPSGRIVTANQDLNSWGKAAPISACMAAYRAERIDALLAAHAGKLEVADHGRIQRDLYSLQAERFMAHWRPLLLDGSAAVDPSAARVLCDWDLRYDVDSLGASAFERVYEALLKQVFGAALGAEVVGHLLQETGTFIDFYGNFDRILLSETSLWFGERSRAQIFRQALTEGLAAQPQRWGERNQLPLTNIFFAGKLPRFMRMDLGPIELPGGRSTVQQGQIYRSGGRLTSFAPSFRWISDLGTQEAWSNLLGGASDRRLSRHYASDLANWQAGRYKRAKLVD